MLLACTPSQPSLPLPSTLFQTFYTAHGDNALFIARNFYKTTAVLKYYGADGPKGGAGGGPDGKQVRRRSRRTC